MTTRVNILDRFASAPEAGRPALIGAGYRFADRYSMSNLNWIASALTDPKTHDASWSDGKNLHKSTLEFDAPHFAEVRFRAGVTDNVASSVAALLHYADARAPQNIWQSGALASSRIYALQKPEDAEGLYNPLIEMVEIISAKQWQEKGFDATIPEVELAPQPRVLPVDLELSDDELMLLSKKGIAEETPQGTRYRGPLGLGLDDLHELQKKYRELGRQITDIELETFAQTWSEHCKHRFFAADIDELEGGLFKNYIKSATDQILAQKPGFCVSVFHDNAGGIAFGDHVLAFKVETHNSPSALDPYGGAMTGVLGVNRDCLGFGMGAEPLANVFGYCLPERADERQFFRQKDGSNPLPSSAELADGVIKGIEEGGNHSGIPTVQGFLYEDASFRGKPLVYCGTLGIIPARVNGPEGEQSSVEKRAAPGDLIYVFGNHVGYDGIHGATFSSVELDDNSPATAVQIGDPITQKNLQDALFKARAQGLYRAITDNGAGGLSSSIGEMAESAGGAEVWLENVALKYPGLAPWEIWISESQERILVSIPPENAEKFETLMGHYQVSTQCVGRFSDDGYLRLCYDGEELGTLEMEFLHDGAPRRFYQSAKPAAPAPKPAPEMTMKAVLALPNFKSRASIFRRYDHEVQGKSLLKPLIGNIESHAAALRPLPSSRKGVALSQAYLPYLTEADPFMAGFAGVDLAIRRLIAAGANPEEIAILDNYCWSRPESGERLWQLKETTRGLYEGAMDYLAPIISGKDSMYNDFRGFDEKGEAVEVNALPTLLISAMGLVDDVNDIASFEFKAEGDVIAVYAPDAQILAKSRIDQHLGTGSAGISEKRARATEYAKFAKARGDFASIEALGEGGIGFAVMRAAMASGMGATIKVDNPFAELDTGFLITAAKDTKLPEGFEIIGETGGHSVRLNEEEESLANLKALYFNSAYGAKA